jgi:hypothetical protein
VERPERATVRVRVQNEFSIKHFRCARNPEEHGEDGTTAHGEPRIQRQRDIEEAVNPRE